MSAAARPRICFVGVDNLPVLAREYNQHGVGGEQVQQTLLARAFVRRGFSVSMTVNDYGQADGAVWDGITTFKTFRKDAGLPAIRFVHPRSTGLWSALRRAQADVYYFSCAGYGLGLLALYAARQRPRPRLVFRVAHDSDCDPRSLLIQYWRDRKIYEYGLARADVVLVQGTRQQQAMLKNYARGSTVATMLVDRPERLREFAQRDIRALWVNNLRDFKRPDLALELARRLAPETLHMIGGAQPGHEALYARIEAEARQLQNLHFHGPVPYHDVNDFYERSRVFINTSDSEGFPNSYLQAWVRGVPVVAFFDPDGVIAREGLGFVPSGMEEMTAIVKRLNAEPGEWQVISERCRRYMAREYDEDRILAPYMQAFGVLIS